MRKPQENPLRSVVDTMLTSTPQTWPLNKWTAWVWGVVHGWSDKQLDDLRIKFDWDDEAVKQLKNLNEAYQKQMHEYDIKLIEQRVLAGISDVSESLYKRVEKGALTAYDAQKMMEDITDYGYAVGAYVSDRRGDIRIKRVDPSKVEKKKRYIIIQEEVNKL